MQRATRFILWAIVIALTASAARADGGYFALAEYTRLKDAPPPPRSDVQQAYLMHFDGMETLCLQSNYRGPEVDFTWVVPVPSRPEVTNGNPAILTAMEGLTRPKLAATGSTGFSLGCAAREVDAEEVDLGVTMLESRRIGEMESVVLSARDGKGLLRWLNDNRFHVPAGAEAVLQDYTAKGFYFVALRFAADQLLPDEEDEDKAEGVDDEEDESEEESRSGDEDEDDDGERTVPLLKLRFATERPFFPLAISSVSAAPESEILLLTVTEHRQKPANYGSMELRKMKAGLKLLQKRRKLPEAPVLEVLKQIGRAGGFVRFAVEAALPVHTEFDADGRPSMTHLVAWTGRSRVRKAFITRFHAVMSPGQMTRDVYFTDAESDDRLDGTIELGAVGGSALTMAALAAVPLGLCGLGCRPRARRRRRSAMLAAAVILLALL